MAALLGQVTPANNNTAVAIPSTTSVTIADPAISMANLFFDSGLFPNAKNVAGVFTIVEYGKEVGIPPVVALQNISIVKGKLCMHGQAMLALVRKHGVEVKIIEEQDDGCKINFKRDGQEYDAWFLESDAKRADLLGKDNWKMYPRDMYKWRAVAKGCRFIAPDVLGGIYLPEEIESVGSIRDAGEPGPDPKIIEEEEIPNATEVPEDPITDGQVKRLHTIMSQTGLIHFKDVLREYLYDMGMVDETKSSKTLRKGDAQLIMDNFTGFETKMYANSKYENLFKTSFSALDKVKKAGVLSSLKGKIADKDSVPEISAEMDDTTLDDLFGLLLKAVQHTVHNQVTEDAKSDGLGVDETIEVLEGLGLQPEVKEVVSLDKEQTLF